MSIRNSKSSSLPLRDLLFHFFNLFWGQFFIFKLDLQLLLQFTCCFSLLYLTSGGSLFVRESFIPKNFDIGNRVARSRMQFWELLSNTFANVLSLLVKWTLYWLMPSLLFYLLLLLSFFFSLGRLRFRLFLLLVLWLFWRLLINLLLLLSLTTLSELFCALILLLCLLLCFSLHCLFLSLLSSLF